MDNNIKIEAHILILRDIDDMNNRLLTATVLGQEILEAVKQLLALIAPRLGGIQSIFYRNVGLL